MMSRSLIQLVKAAANRMTAVGTISRVANNEAELDSVRMYHIANAQIVEMLANSTPDGGWRTLQQIYAFDTIADTDLYPLPNDYGYLLADTAWDNDNKYCIRPLSSREWEYVQRGIATASPYLYYRLIGNYIQIFPKPSQSGITLSFGYVSKFPVLDADGVTKRELFQGDNDTILLDEEAFIRGVIWRWKRMSGLDFSIEFDEYDTYIKRVIARDNGIKTYSLTNNTVGYGLMGGNNIPDSGYGL